MRERHHGPGDALDGGDDTAHRGCLAGAEIEGEGGGCALIQMPQRRNMRRGEIADMDEIALAGPVGGRVIGAEDLQRRPEPDRGIDGERDKMRLRIVALGELAGRIRAGGVEIAQHGDLEAFGGTRVGQDLLACELRASIRADRSLWCALDNGNPLGNTVGRAGAREHDARHAMAQHGLDHVNEARHIDPVIGKRLAHRGAHIGKRGEMDDGVRPVLRECSIDRGAIENVTFDQRAEAREVGMAGREIVKRDRFKPGRRKRLAGMAADEAGAAGDENGLHAGLILRHSPDCCNNEQTSRAETASCRARCASYGCIKSA